MLTPPLRVINGQVLRNLGSKIGLEPKSWEPSNDPEATPWELLSEQELPPGSHSLLYASFQNKLSGSEQSWPERWFRMKKSDPQKGP